MSFDQNLRSEMGRLGYSPEKLAEKVWGTKIMGDVVSAYLNSERQPKQKSLIKLATFLNVQPHKLLAENIFLYELRSKSKYFPFSLSTVTDWICTAIVLIALILTFSPFVHLTLRNDSLLRSDYGESSFDKYGVFEWFDRSFFDLRKSMADSWYTTESKNDQKGQKLKAKLKMLTEGNPDLAKELRQNQSIDNGRLREAPVEFRNAVAEYFPHSWSDVGKPNNDYGKLRQFMAVISIAGLLIWCFEMLAGRRRQRGRARVRAIALKFRKGKFGEIAAQDASIFLAALYKFFGCNLWSFRTMVRTSAVSALVTIALVCLFFLNTDRQADYLAQVMWVQAVSEPVPAMFGVTSNIGLATPEMELIRIAAGFFPINMALDFISLVLTVIFLRWLKSSWNTSRIVGLLLLDLCVALILAAIAITSGLHMKTLNGFTMTAPVSAWGREVERTSVDLYAAYRALGQQVMASQCIANTTLPEIPNLDGQFSAEEQLSTTESLARLFDFSVAACVFGRLKLNSRTVLRELRENASVYIAITLSSLLPTLAHIVFLVGALLAVHFGSHFKNFCRRGLYLMWEKKKGPFALLGSIAGFIGALGSAVLVLI